MNDCAKNLKVTYNRLALCEMPEVWIDKIISYDKIQFFSESIKRQKDRIIFTNGCFDILHTGHLYLLYQAKSLGDILIVGLNSDMSIKSIKGSERPILPEKQRIIQLAALSVVDYIILFNQDTPYEIIERLKPDVLVKGSDWIGNELVGEKVLAQYGGDIVFVDLIEGISTTKIINKIRISL